MCALGSLAAVWKNGDAEPRPFAPGVADWKLQNWSALFMLLELGGVMLLLNTRRRRRCAAPLAAAAEEAEEGALLSIHTTRNAARLNI